MANTVPPDVAATLAKRQPLVNVNNKHEEGMSSLERLASKITDKIGTMGFFLIIFAWTIVWLGWNFLAPANMRFDPAPAFVLWLFISNMIQIFLMPLIMIGQNVQGRHAELRAENDYEINCKAEQEVETILRHIEYQNQILIALVEKEGIKVDQVLKGRQPSAPPEAGPA